MKVVNDCMHKIISGEIFRIRFLRNKFADERFDA